MADSSTIAGAQAITPGQQYYGNLSQDTKDNDNCYSSYWTLAEASGDQISINWQAQDEDQRLYLYPSGTTDYSVGNTNSLDYQGLNSNDANQLNYQTTSDGNLVLDFDDCHSPGPYNFNVTILHGIVATLGALPSAASGTASVNVATPDGAPLGSDISVALQTSVSGGTFTTIGTATATNGVASIPYTLPTSDDGGDVEFQAVASGTNYATATSGTQEVEVPEPAPVPTTPTPTPTPAPTPPSSTPATTKLAAKFYTVKGRGRPPVKALLTVHWTYTGAVTHLTNISVTRFPREGAPQAGLPREGLPDPDPADPRYDGPRTR